jgi:hypothetical protein
MKSTITWVGMAITTASVVLSGICYDMHAYGSARAAGILALLWTTMAVLNTYW